MLSVLKFSVFHKQPQEAFVRKEALGNFAKFTGKHMRQSLFFNKVTDWGGSFWSFLSLLLKISFYFTSTEKWDYKREIPWWSSNIYFFARVSIFLTSKISKEIWQMVIWSENVFKENLLQFSWLEEISA